MKPFEELTLAERVEWLEGWSFQRLDTPVPADMQLTTGSCWHAGFSEAFMTETAQ